MSQQYFRILNLNQLKLFAQMTLNSALHIQIFEQTLAKLKMTEKLLLFRLFRPGPVVNLLTTQSSLATIQNILATTEQHVNRPSKCLINTLATTQNILALWLQVLHIKHFFIFSKSKKKKKQCVHSRPSLEPKRFCKLHSLVLQNQI